MLLLAQKLASLLWEWYLQDPEACPAHRAPSRSEYLFFSGIVRLSLELLFPGGQVLRDNVVKSFLHLAIHFKQSSFDSLFRHLQVKFFSPFRGPSWLERWLIS